MTSNIGLIGLGMMGKNHARVLSTIKDFNFTAVCDTNPELKEQFEHKGLHFYSSVDDFLSNEKLDCVDICVPNTMHEEVALKCLKNDLDVFIEKPISNSTESAEKIVKEAEKRNKKVMVGHIERFNPTIRSLIEKVDPKNIISLQFTRVGPAPVRLGNVGVITDIGVHDIDLTRYLSGQEVTKVFCTASSKDSNAEDFAQILLILENGVSSSLTLNWYTPYKLRQLEVVTKEKIYQADFLLNNLHCFHSYKTGDAPSYKSDKITVDKTEPLHLELLHFADCIKNNKEPLINGKEGIKALKIAEAAIKSYKSGEPVKL